MATGLYRLAKTFSTPVDKARKFQITSYTNLDYSDNVDLIGTEENRNSATRRGA